MVHVSDDGVFDAPLEKVWKYLNDDTGHEHSAMKFTKVLEQSDKGMTVELEVKHPDGSSHMETWKMTMNPPKGHSTEVLSRTNERLQKHTHIHPHGKQNQSHTLKENSTRKAWMTTATKKAVLAMYEMVFNEDNTNLKNYK